MQNTNKQELLIGEVASLTGVSRKALRLYHEKNLLVPIQDEDSGYRYYTQKHLLKLQHIQALKVIGLSLNEIGMMLQDKIDPSVFMTKQVIALEHKIAALQTSLKALKKVQVIEVEDLSVHNICQTIREVQNMESAVEWFNQQTQTTIEKQFPTQLNDAEKEQIKLKWEQLISEARNLIGRNIEDDKVKLLVRDWLTHLDSLVGNLNCHEGIFDLYQAQADIPKDKRFFEPELGNWIAPMLRKAWLKGVV